MLAEIYHFKFIFVFVCLNNGMRMLYKWSFLFLIIIFATFSLKKSYSTHQWQWFSEEPAFRNITQVKYQITRYFVEVSGIRKHEWRIEKQRTIIIVIIQWIFFILDLKSQWSLPQVSKGILGRKFKESFYDL